MTTATRRLEFDAAHRVPGHTGKCRTIHGHRYGVEITVEAIVPDDGMIIDFGIIKQRVGAWIDKHLDHTTLYWADDGYMRRGAAASEAEGDLKPWFAMYAPPTAENIASMIATVADLMMPEVTVTNVGVYETPNCRADAEPLYGVERVHVTRMVRSQETGGPNEASTRAGATWPEGVPQAPPSWDDRV